MNACPKCGGEMRFDISTQSLLCPFCGDREDPGQFHTLGAMAAESGSEMDVIEYSCPQCGGSIYATEQSVNGFCSYCGSHVTLESRVAKMKKPKYIAPFKIDKEGCKRNYLQFVKKAFFAPDEMREAGHLERFRGIYMPYWGYDVQLEGFLSMRGYRGSAGQSVLNGAYICRGWMHSVYNGLFFDASSTFEDRISEQIAPFDHQSLQDFAPGYLSGFYADVPDVPDDAYADEAVEIAKEKALDMGPIKKYYPGVEFDAEQKKGFISTLDATYDGYVTFFPLWFLSYRNKDRVAHAVVNGQTGRVFAELPLDRKKFALGGLLVSLLVFLLLNILPPLSRSALLILSNLFSICSVGLLMYLIKKVYISREQLLDKGAMLKKGQLNYQYHLDRERRKELEQEKKKGLIPLLLAVLLFGLPVLLHYLSGLTGGLAVLTCYSLMVLLELETLTGCGWVVRYAVVKNLSLLGSLILILGGSVLGFYMYLHPEVTSGIQFSVTVMLSGTVLAQFAALEQYNHLVTRPLPQLKRKGGNDHAWD